MVPPLQTMKNSQYHILNDIILIIIIIQHNVGMCLCVMTEYDRRNYKIIILQIMDNLPRHYIIYYTELYTII